LICFEKYLYIGLQISNRKLKDIVEKKLNESYEAQNSDRNTKITNTREFIEKKKKERIEKNKLESLKKKKYIEDRKNKLDELKRTTKELAKSFIKPKVFEINF